MNTAATISMPSMNRSMALRGGAPPSAPTAGDALTTS
jgi:hypothetical protein